MKFELFVTYNGEQKTFIVEDKPIILGWAGNCDVQVGDAEPKIKAAIKKEGDHLLVQIYDNRFPIEINNKKYKTAKVKKSIFFKIGSVDVIVNVEEVAEPAVLPDFQDFDSDDLPEYSDESEEQALDRSQEVMAGTTTQAAPAQPVAKKKLPKIDESLFDSASNKANNQVSLHSVVEDDIFKFNIVFDDDPADGNEFFGFEGLDFSDYVDTEDDSVNKLPTPEIHQTEDSNSIHISFLNNGTLLREKYFALDTKCIFLSSSYNGRNYFQVEDSAQNKAEIAYLRGGQLSVVCPDGYKAVKKVGNNVYPVGQKIIDLGSEEKLVLTKGSSQILIEVTATPPHIKANRYFNVDEKLLKSIATSWIFALFMIGLVTIFPPVRKDQLKKEAVVIYKRKKVKKIEKKLDNSVPTQTEASVAKVTEDVPKPKTEPKKAEPKKTKTVTKVEKQKSKPKDVVKKVTKTKKTTHKPVEKIVKKTPTRKKAPVKQVVKAKAPTVQPKKKFKFKFGSKLKSALASTNNTKLKTAQQDTRLNVSDAIGSTSSVTKSFDSQKFGVSNTQVSRFTAGSKAGRSSVVGTKGLSGKTRSTTAYLEANTKILGALDPELVRKIMREYIPQFRHCYQRELIRNPSVKGVFDVDFQINRSGKGVNVSVKSQGKGFSSTGQTCLTRVVKLIKFPRPKGGGLVDVSQPMNFYKQ